MFREGVMRDLVGHIRGPEYRGVSISPTGVVILPWAPAPCSLPLVVLVPLRGQRDQQSMFSGVSFLLWTRVGLMFSGIRVLGFDPAVV